MISEREREKESPLIMKEEGEGWKGHNQKKQVCAQPGDKLFLETTETLWLRNIKFTLYKSKGQKGVNRTESRERGVGTFELIWERISY